MKTGSFQRVVQKAINDCGRTRAELSRQSGVSESMLCRFMKGETDISLRLLEKLSPLIGIDIVQKAGKRTSKGRKRNGKA